MLRKYYNNRRLPHVIFYLAKRSQYGKPASQVQQPHLERSSEMDKLRCITNTALSLVTNITVMETNFPSREF